MQASQSTNAEGKRSFPSPFTAPILAARRLMERQQHTDQSNDVPEPGGLGTEHPDGLTGAWRGMLRYDEASIVAGLDAGLEAAESATFEDLDPNENFAFASTLAGSNEPLFKSPFVSLGLDSHGNRGPDLRWDRTLKTNDGPDPVAVRAAITRLARESQTKEPVTSKDMAASQNATAFADAVAFEDVARRAWAAAPAEDPALAIKEDLAVPEAARSVRAGTDAPAASGEICVSSAPASPESAIALDEPAPVASVDISNPIVTNEAVLAQAQDAPPLSAVGVSTPASITPTSEEGECLAHDAGNLLSAMRLYSELLCISGVLQERHRHYADDLKLLATRSQKLIDRLLKLGARLSEAPPEDLASGQVDLESQSSLVRELQMYAEQPSSAEAVETSLDALDSAIDLQVYESAPEKPEWLSEQQNAEGTAIQSGPSVMPELSQAGTSIAATLERLGNLLQTISHGALRIDLGPGAALPVDIGLEPLERILVNLVCNATAALGPDGAIRVRAGVRDGGEQGQPGTLVLTVDDSGCGMTAEQISVALGERDDGTAQASAATPRRGLGLSIVRHLVAASGGRLFIQSQPGRGTRVEIHWRTLAQREALPHPATSASAVSLPDPLSFGPNVARKPVGVSRSAVSRIRAGSTIRDRGAVAC